MTKAIITVGLGFGDEGKGATTDALVRRHNADLVVRYSGGHQCGHNVQTPDGRRHTFSQFGAGTLAGAITYLGQHVIIEPLAMEREAMSLAKVHGVLNPFRHIIINHKCLVTTPYHVAANKIRERSLRHGSCGKGIAETRHYWLEHGTDAVMACDLFQAGDLLDKLELMRQRFSVTMQQFISEHTEREYLELLRWKPCDVGSELMRVATTHYLPLATCMPPAKTIIFEGAQGVMLDERYGTHPYTTWSTVTARHALEACEAVGIRSIKRVGVTRAYATRHGPGPLPTYDKGLTETIVDQGNPENPWQGKLRCGWLDLSMMRYALEAVEGVDVLAVNCLDQLPESGGGYCDSYSLLGPMIRTPVVTGVPNQEAQVNLTEALKTLRAKFTNVDSKLELLAKIKELAPIGIVGHGPTHRDREWL